MRKAEDIRNLVASREQSIHVETAVPIVQYRDGEGNLVGHVDGFTDNVGALVAVEGSAEDRELEVLAPVLATREPGLDGAGEIAHIGSDGAEGQAKPEAGQALADDLGKAVPDRIVTAKAGNLRFQVLGRDYRPDEDELIIVVGTVEQLAEDRMVVLNV